MLLIRFSNLNKMVNNNVDQRKSTDYFSFKCWNAGYLHHGMPVILNEKPIYLVFLQIG